MKAEVDEVICAITPEPFQAVGQWYQDFSQTTDEEVHDLLTRKDAPSQGEAAESPAERALIEALRATAHPLTGAARDFDPLMDRIGDARFALLGEASHGTHEFYSERAEITKRLIKEKHFVAVAIEATTSMPPRRLPISDGSRHGCGATRWWSNSSSGCDLTTTRLCRAQQRLAFTVLIFTACTHR
jgi:hypothetical protein